MSSGYRFQAAELVCGSVLSYFWLYIILLLVGFFFFFSFFNNVEGGGRFLTAAFSSELPRYGKDASLSSSTDAVNYANP